MNQSQARELFEAMYASSFESFGTGYLKTDRGCYEDEKLQTLWEGFYKGYSATISEITILKSNNERLDTIGFELEKSLIAKNKIIDSLLIKLNTCKNDYWFMTSLLERCTADRYSEVVKDCVERMKFREPLFKNLSNLGPVGK